MPRTEYRAAKRPGTEWDEFTQAVRERTGVSLTGYKPGQAERRVRWLMQRSGAGQLSDYLSMLDCDPGRLRELRGAMAVHVSEFFRSPDQFRRLSQDVLPKLLAQRPALRVWSAGCSYGAEPYSLALLLDQLAPGGGHFILATDVDELALARAAAADSFSEHDLRNVPPELRRHFRPGSQPGRFALDQAIASRVTFRQHDLVSDSDIADALDVILSAPLCHSERCEESVPPTPYPFDLIICRNVMMYFTNDAKARLFELLHRALRPGGYLFVGDAEVVNALPAGFTQDLVGFYRRIGINEVSGMSAPGSPAVSQDCA